MERTISLKEQLESLKEQLESFDKGITIDSNGHVDAILRRLPKGLYKIDVWDDGKTFTGIDTETDTVEYSQMVKLSCGCCHYYGQREEKFSSLYVSEQFAILEDMIDRYCT